MRLMAMKTAAKNTKKKSAGRVGKAAAKAPAKQAPSRTTVPGKTAKKPAGKDAGLELDPKRIAELLRRLAAAYPNAECALIHRNAWELLVATILSAQCT